MIHHQFPSKQTRTIIAFLPKDIRATSLVRFALMRQNSVSSFDFSQNCLSFTAETSGAEVDFGFFKFS
jgi:hypothetical protein